MRTHARPTALLATLFLLLTMLIADVAAAPVAEAHRARRARAARSARPAPRSPAPPTPENFARLRECESGGNYAAVRRDLYFGAYQFSLRTWRSLGYEGLPYDAAPEVQDEAARALQSRSGWAPWPGCSRKLRLR